jgi:hypothetical protein
MARKSKEQHEKDIVTTIKQHIDILFVYDIFEYYMDMSRQYFYEIGLDKSDTIREAINANRAKAKRHMRSKWIKSDNPTLQITAYRLMADEDETKRLNQRFVDMTVNGKMGVVSEESYNKLIETLENDNKRH